tara:strand:+ start:1359 stop:1586 length:228 start_codon:yes stop_codon:yes gene_type:complete
MKSYQWKTETHVFETHVEDGHVILSAKSRISENPSCKFLLTKADSEGLRDILNDAEFDIRERVGFGDVLEEVKDV